MPNYNNKQLPKLKLKRTPSRRSLMPQWLVSKPERKLQESSTQRLKSRMRLKQSPLLRSWRPNSTTPKLKFWLSFQTSVRSIQTSKNSRPSTFKSKWNKMVTTFNSSQRLVPTSPRWVPQTLIWSRSRPNWTRRIRRLRAWLSNSKRCPLISFNLSHLSTSRRGTTKCNWCN